MPTQSQIDANRENAKLSTGPRTEDGKSASARNSQTHGLFASEPRVEPEEQDFYIEFSETMYNELCPSGLLEDALATEIVQATWRLRQCVLAEDEIQGYNEAADKTRRSVERARAAANCALNRSLTRLGKLQTERVIRQQLQLGDLSHMPMADSRNLMNAHYRFDRGLQMARKTGAANAQSLVDQLINSPPPPLPDATTELASFCKTDEPNGPAAPAASAEHLGQLASDGAKAAALYLAAFEARQNNPNLPCICRSGQTYAQCCGADEAGSPALSPQSPVSATEPRVNDLENAA